MLVKRRRPFVELDQCHHIGHVVGEGRMIDAVIGDEAEDLAEPRHGCPGEIGGEAMRAALRGGNHKLPQALQRGSSRRCSRAACQ